MKGLACYTEQVSRTGVATQPAQLGRSRGGQQNWARTRQCPRERVAPMTAPPESSQKTCRKRWRASATTSVSNRGTWTVEGWVGRPLLVLQPSFRLHRPPVSMATTTRRHLSPERSSAYFNSLSARAPAHTMPSTAPAPGRGVPEAVRAHLRVMSTATELRERAEGLMPELPQLFRRRHSCQPIWHCNGLKHLLLANVRSGASALVRSLPECGHAALWRPLESKAAPHSHLASVTGSGTLKRSKNRTRNRTGSILNSGLVGQPCNKCEQPLPE